MIGNAYMVFDDFVESDMSFVRLVTPQVIFADEYFS